MKKLALTFALLVLYTFTVWSQSATVTIFSQDGEKFWVILDGIKQNTTPNTNVKVTGLTSPNYRLKIIFDDEKLKSIDKSIMTRDVDNVLCDQTYIIKKDKKGKHVMRLNSFEPAKPSSATAEPNQTAVPFTTEEKKPEPVTTTTTTTTTQQTESKQPARGDQKPTVGVSVKDPETGETISMDMNISETGVGVNVKAPGNEQVNMNVNVDGKQNVNTHTQVTTTTTSATGRDNKQTEVRKPEEPTREAYKMPGYSGANNCYYPMSDNDFADAKKSISSKSFEDSKLTIAKQITSANCLLASQVKDIMGLFSFEDTKLQFAKYAYTYTFDIGNYYKVNDAFTFEMSIDELNDFISSQKK